MQPSHPRFSCKPWKKIHCIALVTTGPLWVISRSSQDTVGHGCAMSRRANHTAITLNGAIHLQNRTLKAAAAQFENSAILTASKSITQLPHVMLPGLKVNLTNVQAIHGPLPNVESPSDHTNPPKKQMLWSRTLHNEHFYHYHFYTVKCTETEHPALIYMYFLPC